MSETRKMRKKAKYRWGSHSKTNAKTRSKPAKVKRVWDEPKSEYRRRQQTVIGYIDWVQEKWDQGYDLYLFTFMFNQMAGKERAKIEQMKSDVERFYGRLATRFARKPRTPGGMRLLPWFFVYPDNRVYKSCPREIRESTINDGVHIHGICAADRRGRIAISLEAYIEEHHDSILGLDRRSKSGRRLPAPTKIQRVHVEPVTHIPATVADYALKSMKRFRFEHDDMLIFPRRVEDMPDQSQEAAFRKREEQADAKEVRRNRRINLSRLQYAAATAGASREAAKGLKSSVLASIASVQVASWGRLINGSNVLRLHRTMADIRRVELPRVQMPLGPRRQLRRAIVRRR